MPYLVCAEIEKPGGGTFKTEANIKRATQKAQELRSHGLLVLITDPQDEPLDETK